MDEDQLNKIIKKCQEYDRKSQQVIFDLFAGKMMTICLRYTRNQMDAEDVFQDAFITVFSKLGQYQFKGSFEGWMRRVFSNTALRFLEKKKLFLPLANSMFENESSAFDFEANADKAENILNLIKNLPDGYKIVFNMYVFEGYDHNEIADFLKISASTSRSQLTKARKYLKVELEKHKLI